MNDSAAAGAAVPDLQLLKDNLTILRGTGLAERFAVPGGNSGSQGMPANGEIVALAAWTGMQGIEMCLSDHHTSTALLHELIEAVEDYSRENQELRDLVLREFPGTGGEARPGSSGRKRLGTGGLSNFVAQGNSANGAERYTGPGKFLFWFIAVVVAADQIFGLATTILGLREKLAWGTHILGPIGLLIMLFFAAQGDRFCRWVACAFLVLKGLLSIVVIGRLYLEIDGALKPESSELMWSIFRAPLLSGLIQGALYVVFGLSIGFLPPIRKYLDSRTPGNL